MYFVYFTMFFLSFGVNLFWLLGHLDTEFSNHGGGDNCEI